jgi:Zn finger protein HypA/HybF involved in hydrogenase expression
MGDCASGTKLDSQVSETPDVQEFMADNAPQNPVFQVDSTAFDCCRPKVICRSCGTVILPRLRQAVATLRCPDCAALHRIQRQGNRWAVELLESDTEPDSDSST